LYYLKNSYFVAVYNFVFSPVKGINITFCDKNIDFEKIFTIFKYRKTFLEEPKMKPSVGISDIGIFIPENRISLETIKERRAEVEPKLERRLRAAISSTGQQYIRFPSILQDTVTLAAESIRTLMKGKDALWPKQRYHAVGTESTVDQSKPVAAYVNGVLEKKGYPVAASQTTFQVQHACAGGTAGLISVASLLSAANRQDDMGIVSCSDVARYETFSTAEITQGSGAASLLIELNPKLLSIDLETQGLYSSDVDDFFRPIGSVTAKVKGRYSMECYDAALEGAVQDHATRKGQTMEEVLKETDMFVLHVPFYKMPYNALKKLISRQLDIHKEDLESFLDERCFRESIEPIQYIGNTYTASTYITLAFQLKAMYEKLGDAIVGKKVLMASYGSGNTMIVLEGRVAADAPKVISSWDLKGILDQYKEASFQEYEEWIAGKGTPQEFQQKRQDLSVEPDAVSLVEIREDGYRVYE